MISLNISLGKHIIHMMVLLVHLHLLLVNSWTVGQRLVLLVNSFRATHITRFSFRLANHMKQHHIRLAQHITRFIKHITRFLKPRTHMMRFRAVHDEI